MTKAGKVAVALLVAAAAGLAGGYATLHVLRQRVVDQVEARFAALRTTFATAEHGAIEADPWNKRVSIAGVSLLPKDAKPDQAVTIGSVAASGIGRDSSGAFTAERIDITDLKMPAPTVAGEVMAGVYQVPALSLDKTVLRQPSQTASTPAGALIRAWQGVTAAAITVPLVKMSATVEQPVGARGAKMQMVIAQEQHNIRLDGIDAGRIAKLTAERMTITSRGAGNSDGDLDGEIRDVFVTGYDVGSLIDLVEPAPAGAKVTYAPMWTESGVGKMNVKVGKLATVALDGATMKDGAVDWSLLKRSLDVIKAAQPSPQAPPGQRPGNPQQQIALANAVADIYAGVRLGPFEYHGLEITVTGMPPIKLARVAIDGLKDGVVSRFEMAGLDGRSPRNDRFALDRFSLKGMRIAELMRLSGRMPVALAAGAPPSQLAADMMHLIEAIEIDNLIVPDAKGGPSVTVKSLRGNWDNFVGAIPTNVDFSLSASTPLTAATMEPFAALVRSGTTSTTFDIRGKVRWDEPSKRMTIGPVETQYKDLGSARLTADIANVSRQTLLAGAASWPSTAAELELAGFSLMIEDKGALKLAASDAALQMQRQSAIAALTTPDPAQPPQPDEVIGLKGKVARFLDTPGGRLTVTLAPGSKLTLGDLMGAAASPSELVALAARRLATDVSAP